MLAAALALPRVPCPLSPQETLEARQHWYQAGKTPYPAWYFFGCREKGVEGLVEMYARCNLEVVLLPVSLLSGKINADFLDVQFCSLPSTLYQEIKSQGIPVFGYLPDSYSSKTFQANCLRRHKGRRFLPVQAVLSRKTTPKLPQNPSKLWILKASEGSAGHDRSGKPYTVWLEDKLRDSLPHIIASLAEGEDLICSEFILTDDPHAGSADHVVHKMHFLGDTNVPVTPYGTACQRFIYYCNWQALYERKVLPLGEFIGSPEITTGSIASIPEFPPFAAALSFLKGRAMFSVDFMVPPNGVPRFLEINKLAATFAERFDPHLPPLIDSYASMHI